MATLELRPVAVEDAPIVHDLIRAGEIQDRCPLVTSLAEVAQMFEEPHFDPARHGRLVFVDGDPAGWGRLWHIPSGVREERAYLSGTVHPAHRGHGVGTALFEWQVEEATRLVAAYPHDLPRFLRTQQYEWIEDAVALYERHGFSPVRWNEELLRPLDDPPSPPAVAGIEIVPWDRSRDPEILEVKNASFADHWGSTPTDRPTWSSWLDEEVTRLDLSFLALAGDEVVGYSLNEHYPHDAELHGRLDGWIGSLGVLRAWRGQGIASALIGASLHAFVEAGFTHAALGVDSDNPTGAAGLYRRLGFELQQRLVTHQRPVEPAQGSR